MQCRTYCSHWFKAGWRLVLEIVGVGDLSWSPDALVGRVINVLSTPFTLVQGILLHRWLPFSATRSFFTFGVGHRRWDPITILLIIPIFWLLGFGIRDTAWFVLEPVIGLGGVSVNNLEWFILIPILWLLGIWIGNASLINPVGWLLVILVVNLLFGIDGW